MILSFCHAPMRRSGPKRTIFMFFLHFSCSRFQVQSSSLGARTFEPNIEHAAILAACDSVSQCFRRLHIEFEPTAMLMNHHAVVAPSRFERDVSGTYIGKHALRVALHGLPKSPAPTHFNQKSIAGFEGDVSRILARR